MHLIQPEFTYSAGGSFTRNKEKLQKINETRDSRYINQNKLDKVCFQHDMTHGDFKYLTRRIVFNNVLCDKAFNIAKNPKYDGNEKSIASMVYVVLIKSRQVVELTEELQEL